ncbi:MAG: hypothetical protein WCE35_26955 [Bradyrhizobium sp.]
MKIDASDYRFNFKSQVNPIENRHCERQRSNPSRRAKKEWIASSQVLLAMTADEKPRSRGAMRPRFAENFRPFEERAQGRPGAGWHPRSRVQDCA